MLWMPPSPHSWPPESPWDFRSLSSLLGGGGCCLCLAKLQRCCLLSASLRAALRAENSFALGQPSCLVCCLTGPGLMMSKTLSKDAGVDRTCLCPWVRLHGQGSAQELDGPRAIPPLWNPFGDGSGAPLRGQPTSMTSSGRLASMCTLRDPSRV